MRINFISQLTLPLTRHSVIVPTLITPNILTRQPPHPGSGRKGGLLEPDCGYPDNQLEEAEEPKRQSAAANKYIHDARVGAVTNTPLAH